MKASVRRRRERCSAALLTVVGLVGWAPAAGSAQTIGSLDGRVQEVETAGGIPNAVVELVGHGATLSATDGLFRFTGVTPGEYALRVRAFGYADYDGVVVVAADSQVTVELRPNPLPLDSLVVALESIDIDGRVRDQPQGEPLMNVEVLVNRQPTATTSPRGRFTLRQVWAETPILLSLRSFGYLPVDTVITPHEEDSYTFELIPDSLVQFLIDVQVAQLQERMHGDRAIAMPPIDRERLLGWSGVTLWEVLAGTYQTRWRRIGCVVVDEKAVPSMVRRNVLQTMLPGEVERMEFLHGGTMVRIYTRDFMRDMVAGLVELRRPVPRSCI